MFGSATKRSARIIAVQASGHFSISLLRQSLTDQRPGQGEGLAELAGIFAAGLGHGGLAAAAAAHDLGDLADQLAGVQTLLDQIVTYGGDEADLAVVVPADDDGTRLHLLLEAIHLAAQLFLWPRGHLADDNAGAADLLRARQKLVAGARQVRGRPLL